MSMNRATFFFKDANDRGWTETFHNNLVTLTGVLGNAQTLLALRIQLLGTGALCTYIRVSDDDVFRDSQVFTVPSQNSKGVFNSPSTSGDVCLITRSIPSPLTTSVVRKITYLRGLPQDILGTSGSYNPSPAWNTAFANWAQGLANGNWSIKTIDRLIVPQIVTAAVQVVPTGIVTVTTAGAHGLNAGSGVNISGVLGATQINGRWGVITVPSATTFTIQVFQIMDPYIGGGIAKAVGYVLLPISKVSDERISERKCGRPFDSRRGRRGRRRVKA